VAAERPAAPCGLLVAHVQGPAGAAGLQPGDCVARRNGAPPHDVLDLELAAADGTLWLTVVREGHPLDLTVVLKGGEWHGISLAHGGLGVPPVMCRNRCRFCFVDQVPRGLRPSLYEKDDDYRLSFLHGNFTTLAGASEDDLARIVELRLSPLYVSLHAWDDDLRVRLMGRASTGSRAAVERLAAGGIELHLQVVLCPGWNDGDVLDETIAHALALPAVADLGVVPVSLAAEGELRRVTATDARRALGSVAAWQERARAQRGRAFVHAADELHLAIGAIPPPADTPDQLENGIGMAAELLDDAAELAHAPRHGVALRLLCGTLAEPVLRRAAGLLTTTGAPVRPFPVANELFGPHVTVTGLLGGEEVLAALAHQPLAADEWLLAPRSFLPEALGRTLDDVGEDALLAACGGRLVLAPSLRDAYATLAR
jgi:putative radical SAM enzyme (TIGR03279 family)